MVQSCLNVFCPSQTCFALFVFFSLRRIVGLRAAEDSCPTCVTSPDRVIWSSSTTHRTLSPGLWRSGHDTWCRGDSKLQRRWTRQRRWQLSFVPVPGPGSPDRRPGSSPSCLQMMPPLLPGVTRLCQIIGSQLLVTRYHPGHRWALAARHPATGHQVHSQLVWHRSELV